MSRDQVTVQCIRWKPEGLCGGILFVMAMLLTAWGASCHSPTLDETSHLVSGLSHWELARFEAYAVNPPLVRMLATLPVLAMDPKTDWSPMERAELKVSDRVEWRLARRFVALNGPRSLAMLTVARVTVAPLAGIGLLVCCAWWRKLSDSSVVVPGMLLCFSPTWLGHASLMTPDASAAAMGVLAVYVLRRWLIDHSWASVIAVAAVGTAAILTKMTWLVVFPAVVFSTWLISLGMAAANRSAWRLQAVQLVSAACVGLLLLNLAYGFEGTLTQLRDIPFESQLMAHNEIPGITWPVNRFTEGFIGSIPIPLPTSFVQGLDVQRFDFDAGFRSYLMGEWKHGGWWYYYLVGFLVKEPIGFQLLLYVSILHGVWCWKRWTRETIREWSLIVVPPVLIFALVSSQTGFNHHMRYVLPAYPFLFIIAARTVTLGRFWTWFTYACLTWQAAAVLWFAPHWLSYFNEAAGGPKNGHDWLVDSNIDWGQDILGLKWWQDKHPDIDLQAALSSGFDPKDIGLKYRLPAPYIKGRPDVVSKDGLRGPQPGWYAVSVCLLKGQRFGVPDGDGNSISSSGHFTYFMDHFEPVEMIGYSIYIYHITEAQAAQVRVKLEAE